jgi:hypothetical protein
MDEWKRLSLEIDGAGQTGRQEIAKALKRTIGATRAMAVKLGISLSTGG